MLGPFDIAADLDTPVSAYLKLRSFAPRFLLESVECGERLGRYSFIGLGDGLEVRLEGDRLKVGGDSFAAPTDRRSMLDALRRALAQAPRPGPAPAGLPFLGGLVGATAWNLARRFEGAPIAGAAGPEALYVAPRSLLAFDHLTRRVALLHDGPEADRARLRREIVEALRGPLPTRPGPGRHAAPRRSLDEAAFGAAMGRAREAILDGEVYQLVLSVKFEGEADLDPFSVYRALRLLNPSPYLYFLEFPELSIVGSSPEALVRLDGREAALRPIAGTRPRGTDAETDDALERELLADPKEAAEHVMLVDLARNDLGRVAVTGSVRVDPFRSVERYSHVMHLVSGVRGVLEPEADAFDLFASAFPAGTVSGAPKLRAMELIDEIEPVPRDLYAGTVGYFGHGGGLDQAIAIRTIVLRPGSYSFQAGAGIVADSIAEREYREIEAKAGVLAQALRLAEEGP